MSKGLDYTTLVDSAMRGVVRDVLRQVQQYGLAEPHHFFVTFRTDFPGVVMSDTLRSKYPHEITIVLQHQFRELKVEQDLFKVVLSFNNVPERLTVPYDALTGFADPSMKFGLQFQASDEHMSTGFPASAISTESLAAAVDAGQSDEKSGATVFTLDAFRKK